MIRWRILMPTLKLDDMHDVTFEHDRALDETSGERFDRIGFALRALELVRPPRTTVALCEGSRLRLEAGRAWGGDPGDRWALLAIPPTASRRAIATAVAELSRAPRPYVLDLLFA
jgi:hypothetical protein